jgi:hypothetical protein
MISILAAGVEPDTPVDDIDPLADDRRHVRNPLQASACGAPVGDPVP